MKDDLTVTNSVWFLAALGIDPVDHRTPPISIESNLEVPPSGKHHGGTILEVVFIGSQVVGQFEADSSLRFQFSQ